MKVKKINADKIVYNLNTYEKIIIIALLIALAFTSYKYIFSESTALPDSNQSENSSVSTLPDTEETKNLRAEGSSYSDPNGLYTFMYPRDYTLDTSDAKHIRIYKRGDSDRPMGEMTDGILIVFESLDLQSQTLENLVDSQIENSISEDSVQIIKPKTKLFLNDYIGFSYEARGFGIATYNFIQKNQSSKNALALTYSISDPKNIDYQSEFDAIFSTIELQK